MKYIINLFLRLSTLVCILLGFISCENEEVYLSTPTEKEQASVIQTKALSTDYPSVSNPTLHDNWENVRTIYLNNGPEIDAPWVIKEGNSMNIPDDFRIDIKKEDGWKLLGHSMIKRESGEPNYIFLYNKKRGLLKMFYYNLTEQKNNNFIWIMESTKGATSIFPTNTGLQGPLNSKYEYVATSNVLRNSDFNFGALYKGWNACSFVLVYGTIDKEPLISIKGYNDEKGTINLSGTFSGSLEIEVPQNNPNPFDAIAGKLAPITSLLPGAWHITEGISLASAAIGGLSVFETASFTTIKGRMSGTSELTGSVITPLAGSVHTTDIINLRRINNNEDLGVWNLSKTPSFEYPLYERLSPDPSFPYTIKVRGNLNLYPKEDLTSLVQINPIVASLIKSYRVVDYKFTFPKPEINYRGRIRISDKCFYYPFISFSAEYVTNNDPSTTYILKHTPESIPNLTVTVEFIYNDGSKMIESRNYPINIVPRNNDYIINQVSGNYYIINSSWIVFDKYY